MFQYNQREADREESLVLRTEHHCTVLPKYGMLEVYFNIVLLHSYNIIVRNNMHQEAITIYETSYSG